MRTMVAMRAYALSALVVVVAVSVSAPAAAQTGTPDPAAPPPLTAPLAPVEPLTGTEPPPATPSGAPSTVVPVPSVPPPSVAASAPAPVAPAPSPPIFERWWFWTAIGAVAVTTVVILAVSSGPSTPRTDLGNMPAF